MPSLNELKEFRDSFYNIANERKDVLAKNLPFDNIKLPDKDAPSFDYSRKDNMPGIPAQAQPAASDSSEANANEDTFDWSAFVDPGDENPDPELDSFLNGLSPDSENTQTETEEDDDASMLSALLGTNTESDKKPPDLGSEINDDEGSIPDDLLSGLSDETESLSDEPGLNDEIPFDVSDILPTDDQEEDLPPSGTDEVQFDDIPDAIDMGGENQKGEFSNTDSSTDTDSTFDLPDEFSFPTDEPSDDDLDGESIDMGGETRTGEFSSQSDVEDDESAPLDSGGLDDLGDMGFPVDDDSGFDNLSGLGDDFPGDGGLGDSFPSDGSLGDDFPGDGGLGDDFPSDSSLGEDFPSDSSLGDDFLGNLDFPDDDPLSGLDFPEDDSSGADTLLGLDDFGSDAIDLDTGGTLPDETLDSDGADYTMPELDMFLDKPKTDVTIDVPVKKRFSFGKKKKSVEEAPSISDVEEISLSQNDINKLLQTLAAYPLNLRIACEEAIAEQVILPQQLSKLIRLLVTGAPVKETAVLVEEITGKPIVIPKSFEKSTGAAFEEEQASFAYIFVHNFLPVFRLVAVIVILAASVAYLTYKFVYIPLKAESLYKRGYERIFAGEYQRANDLFHQAFSLHKKKKWFYAYAENFRDRRHYILAEGKYDELLRNYPRDKKGVLDYAHMQTYYLLNYDKANNLLQKQLLDYAPNDMQGLLAAGDNFLAWADSDPERFGDRYEDARFSYARLLENYGWQAPFLERMMKYFIRTDNLKEVLQLRAWFEADEKKRRMTTESLAELGGYLLDKQMERPTGVPNPYIESIESVRAMLLKAITEDRNLPEPHYHLARYHKNLSNTYEERLTLENAIRAFDLAKTETVKRRLNRVDAHYRLSQLLVNNKEFFPAERQIARGIELYEEFLTRNLLRSFPHPQLGQLYSSKGDLEFYTKTGDRTAAANALNDYRNAERYGYTPPEMQYRMGAAYYQLEDWGNALTYLFRASSEMPFNNRMLYALGNATYKRGDYFAAQGYFNRLLDILENQRVRLPVLLPNDNPQFLELGERLMMARNNAGVIYEALAEQTGNREYRSRAMALYAESARAWDAITRNPETMVRMRLTEIPGAPGINLGYLNANNALRPASGYNPGIFTRIDRDGVEPSHWEQIASFGN